MTFSPLVGGLAECKTCIWSGPQTQLIAYSFEHDFQDRAEVLQFMMNDVRKVFASCATQMGEMLMKWGFLDLVVGPAGRSINRQQLARYVAAIARAVLKAIIAERAKLEEERVNGT